MFRMGSLDKEEWKPCSFKELNGIYYDFSKYYYISNYGRVKTFGATCIDILGRPYYRGARIIKLDKTNKNCLRAIFFLEGVRYRFLIHRLVLLLFGELPKNKDQNDVNHIDGNRLNNHISNLEWNTDSENIKHAFRLGLNKPHFGVNNHKSKIVLDLQTGIYYDAMSEAAVAKGFKYKWVSKQMSRKDNKTSLIYA
jgi:hypothetical protein